MSTLADINTAIAAYQAGEADIAAQVVVMQAAEAAWDQATTTGQASVDAATAARDSAVAAAQSELNTERAATETLVGINSVRYEAVFEALRNYVP